VLRKSISLHYFLLHQSPALSQCDTACHMSQSNEAQLNAVQPACHSTDTSVTRCLAGELTHHCSCQPCMLASTACHTQCQPAPHNTHDASQHCTPHMVPASTAGHTRCQPALHDIHGASQHHMPHTVPVSTA